MEGFQRTAKTIASVCKYIRSSAEVVSCSISTHIGAHHLQSRFSAPNVVSIVFRISTEHSPKLQIRSHSYLRAVSEVSINRSLDSLDPAGLLASPKFRSRNESYMRAMSTISQVSEGRNSSSGLSCSFNSDKVWQRSRPVVKCEVTIRSPSGNLNPWVSQLEYCSACFLLEFRWFSYWPEQPVCLY